MEPGVERIELDGPVATGTVGRTVSVGYQHEWVLADVIDLERFTIMGFTPDGAGSLSFTWDFADDGDGTRLTQRISAAGPDVRSHMPLFQEMEKRAPAALAKLAEALDRLASEEGYVGSNA
jgi:hypothetical protein